MDAIVVGSMAFDSIETPFGTREKIVGGAGTYIAWCASFFTSVEQISIIGGDFPQEEIDLLKRRNVGMEGVQCIKEAKTFFWKGKYHTDMNQRDTLATELNVLENFSPILPAKAKKIKYVMLGNLHPIVQLEVVNQLAEKPKLVVLDTMNFWMNNALEDLKKTLLKTDVLLINDSEAKQLSGVDGMTEAAKIIMKMGPSIVIIKKGEHGALVFYQDKIFSAPALPLETVIDPTGAGDSFAGGFIGYLAKTDDISFENIKKAVIVGSTMASFCVEDFGIDQLRKLDLSAIKNRLNQFYTLSHFDPITV